MKKQIILFLTSCALMSVASPLPKLVVTHAMGMMPAGVGNQWDISRIYPMNDYAENRHDFAKMYGGADRLMPLAKLYAFVKQDGSFSFNEPLSPDQMIPSAVKYRRQPYRWDLEKAEEQGIDGFGLCLSGNEASYPHLISWFRTLESMLVENPGLKIRLIPMICGNDLAERANDPKKFAYFTRFMNDFRNSPAWLRHEGRPILIGYKSHVTWKAEEYVNPEYIKGPIEMHKEFFKEHGLENAIFLFDGAEYVPGQISPSRVNGSPEQLGRVAEVVCEFFEGYGCWGGVIPDDIYRKNYPPIAKAVHEKKRAWMMPIVNIHSGIGQFYRSKPGVERLVETWNFAMETNAEIAQIVTWNDWREATGFAPSNSFNYALAGLNGKFIYRFKHGKFPESKRDEVFLFYRKYHPDVDPELYPRATVERDRDLWGETDDMLHVFIFAKAAGKAEISGTSYGVETVPLEKGYNEFKFKTAVGKEIAVRIYRNEKLEHELISPERVTKRPFREDLIPWGWSSLCREQYDRDFGRGFRPLSDNSERWNDGIPDWFRLYWFGTTEQIPGSGINDDPDNDGISNLREYLLGENPLKPNPIYADGFRWDCLKRALSPIDDKTQPAKERINLNPFPDANGKLVHGFLYCSTEKFNGVYPWMMKWVNQEQEAVVGWTFRSGIKHHYTLGKNNGINMVLASGLAGIYRFLAPVQGSYAVKATVYNFTGTPVSLRVMNGTHELRKMDCAPQGTTTLSLIISLERRSKLDFIITALDRASLELVPEIVLQRNEENLGKY